MTAMVYPKAGASSACNNWNAIDWQTAVAHVRRLQMRIAKAYREGKRGKVHQTLYVEVTEDNFYRRVVLGSKGKVNLYQTYGYRTCAEDLVPFP